MRIWKSAVAAGLAAWAMAGASQAAEPPSRSPISKPTDAEIAAVYPRGQSGAGSVTLRCTLTAQGKLQDCTVASEAPRGRGFGAAALKLAPGYTFEPEMKGGVPAPAPISFPLRIGDTWGQSPTDQEIDDAWPAEARRAGVHGEAVVSCAVAAQGAMTDCKLVLEGPKDRGFGAAALALAGRYVRKVPASGRLPPRVLLPFYWPRDSSDVQPYWARKPAPEALAAMWPAKAGGKGGRAVINCTVTVQGPLRDCWVSEEEPEGLGFGGAALALSPDFVMRPATKAGQPVETHVTIPITWTASDVPSGPSYRVANTLPWAKAPTSAEVAAAYPKDALAKGRSGHAVVRCNVGRDGRLSGCESMDADNSEFGYAAQSLTAKFQALIDPAEATQPVALKINLAFQFSPPPPAGQARYLPKAVWMKMLPSETIQGAFPAKALAAGLITGRGVADCAVAAGGQLTGCVPIGEDPAGMDFGVMAAKLAEIMALNPWSEDGLPAEGARIRVPIRFQAKDPTTAPTAVHAP